ncbi:MAG TPA: arsenic resistance N-acetyltransferase ArsN2 [Cyclobacteriaceae bacterium]|nr:arsenic resistance N-acetyltransferase ArsN2 [Cyclobacteriaceae bacterium]
MHSQVITNQEALDDVLALLKKNKLPFQDIALGKSLMMSYRDSNNALIGSGGLEFYGHYALLRSLAVDETQRGRSLGKQITADLINHAKSKSNKSIFLLTETAHDFFLKLGFRDISRNEVPEEVKLSSEFTTACPESAACMMYQL